MGMEEWSSWQSGERPFWLEKNGTVIGEGELAGAIDIGFLDGEVKVIGEEIEIDGAIAEPEIDGVRALEEREFWEGAGDRA